MVELSEEQRMLKKAARDWAEKEVAPLVNEAEEKEEFPVRLFHKAAELGYLGLGVPEKDGGAGGGVTEEVIFKEEVARISAGIAQGLGRASQPLIIAGTEEQKEKYLRPTLAGEKIQALGLTEPEAGSDAAAIQTIAKREGDGYIINGHKQFTTNGNVCDWLEVYAYTDKSKGTSGVSLFIVDSNTPGFRVIKKMNKVGIRSAQTAEEIFEDVVVPKENLVGEEGQGLEIFLGELEASRLFVAASSLGTAERALELSLEYAKKRVTFGKAIAKRESIRSLLADMAMDIYGLRLMLEDVARKIDEGKSCPLEASIAKTHGLETVCRVTDKAILVHGGRSYLQSWPIERLFREARLNVLEEGTPSIQRMVTARALLSGQLPWALPW